MQIIREKHVFFSLSYKQPFIAEYRVSFSEVVGTDPCDSDEMLNSHQQQEMIYKYSLLECEALDKSRK